MNQRNPHRNTGTALLVVCLFLASTTEATAFDADEDFRYATNLFRKQRWKYAAEAFESFLKEHKSHPRTEIARLYLGLSLNSLEQYAPARVQFEAFAKANPTSRNLGDAHYRIGECSYYLREYGRATTELKAYLQQHKGHALNSWAELILAESYNAQEDWGSAESVARALVEGKPSANILADSHFALAVALQGQNKSAEAIQNFEQVVSLKSEALSHRALARIGSIHFAAERFAEASAAWDRLATEFSSKPPAASASLRSGIARFQLRQFDEALARLNRVPEKSSVSVLASMWKGICRREMGQLDAARRELTLAFTAAGDDPVGAEILFNRAQIEVLDGKKELAAQMFADLIARWPEDDRVDDCLFNAAELRMETGDTDASGQLLERLKKDFPEQAAQPRVAILTGRLLLNQGKVPESIAVLQAVEVPADADTREQLLRNYHLIRALHRGKKFAEAVSVFDPLRESFRGDEAAEFRGAIALAAMSCLDVQDYTKAQMLAAEFLSVEKDPTRHADALAVHAVAASHLKMFDAARQDLGRLTQDFAENAQTWIAVLQSAEAAWQHEDFSVSGEFFALAVDRREDPKRHLAALLGAAWSQYRLQMYPPAAELFRRVSSEYPDSDEAAEARYMEASCVREAGESDDAAALFLAVYEALEKTPDTESERMKWLLDSGRTYARITNESGDQQTAAAMWERIAKRFDSSAELPEILDEWAYVCLQNEQYARADEIYARLLERFPDCRFAGQARLSLAESQMQANRLDVALREFTAIAFHDSYNAPEKEAALYHAIDIHAAKREWPEVVRLAELFARDYGSSELAPNVQLLYAEGLLDGNKLTEASEKLQSLRAAVLDGSLKADPWTDRIWVALAEVALAQKEYPKVDEVAEELAARKPESRFQYQIWDVQGRRWKMQAEPDFEKARSYFSKVIQHETSRGTETAARCQFLIAESHFFQSDYKAALKEYYRVYLNYAYDDWRAIGLYQAAGCEEKLMEFEAAMRSYADLISDFPDSEFAEKAKARLEALRAASN